MNNKLKSFFQKLRILPILIVVASMAFVVRIGDAYVSMKSLSGAAYAEEAVKEEKKAEKAADVGSEAAPTPPESDLKSKDEVAEKVETAEKDSAPSTEPEKKWEDASDTDIENSTIKKEMYQDLTNRRLEIEEKEKKLGEREALLEAAQKELDRKVKEMEGLRDELRELLKQQTAAEAMRIQSLVKIYSGMKPKDAARIFDTLDTDILMDVVGNMPESKASPIIALMSADRAKALTTLLAEQKKLPDVP